MARVEARRAGDAIPEDIIFFVEHSPVYTLGKHGDLSHLLIPEQVLLDRHIEFVGIERGGDITYHGPGQLTVYPILDLQRYRLGIKDYIHLLEQSVIDTISEFGIIGERIEGRTGVWIGKNTTRERKICAIGVKCSRFITMHGLALNVGADLSGFAGIIPCGLSQGVTSIALEQSEGPATPSDTSVETVQPILSRNLTRLLQLRIPSPETP